MSAEDAGRDAARPPNVDASMPSDAASTLDAQTTPDAAATTDAGTRVPVFVAVGYGFRRVISCDDGRTWEHDEVEDPNGGDDATLARGLAYGDGVFVVAVGGGGATGRVLSSTDGVLWTPRIAVGRYNGFSQAAYDDGLFVVGGGHVSIRSADGASYEPSVNMGSGGILRHVTGGGGRFNAVGGQRIQTSEDGTSWRAPTGACGEPLELAYGGGRFLAVDANGVTCLSTNGGDTWTNGSVGGGDVRGVVHTGERFLVTAGTVHYVSTDGVAWSGARAGGGPEHLAVSDVGTVVGFRDGRFFYSEDGETFSPAVTPASPGERGITRIVFGYADRSSACP